MGLAMRACALDAETTSSFGANVSAIIAVNFLIGSAMAGAAGVLIGVYDNQVWPTMGSIPAYKALAIVVLAIPFPRDAVASLAMILVLMFKPYGLLGKA